MGNPDRPPPLSFYAFERLWQSLLRLGVIMRAETARSQILAILNVRGASKVIWEWNASQAERYAVYCFSSLGARSLQHNVSALRASQSHRAISRQAMLCNETRRRRPP